MELQISLDFQLDLYSSIIKFGENFSKEGPTRRKRKGPIFHENKLKDLDDVWEEFEKMDVELRKHLPPDHEYLAKDLKGEAQSQYKKVRLMIEKALVSDFESPESPQAKLKLRSHTTDQEATSVEALESLNEQPIPRPNPAFVARLNDILDSLNRDVPTRNSTPEPILNGERPNVPKLPPIKVTKFSGDEKDWQPFIELFNSVIHRNPTLSDVEKLRYLRSYLEQQPYKLIKHLSLTSANYKSALDILKKRYENKRVMVASYIDTITQHKKLSPGSAADVIQLHDTVNACINGLENLDFEVNFWDPILIAIISGKFDSETSKAFEESLYDITQIPTLRSMLDFLLKRYRILRQVPKENAPKEKKKRAFHTTSTDTLTCSKCNGDHILARCDDFKKLSLSEKRKHVKDKNICFKCLRHDKSKKCSSKKSCATCSKTGHHSLLHDDNFSKESKGDRDNQKKAAKALHVRSSQEDEEEHSEDSEADITALHSSSRTVVMPTAIIKIKSRAGEWVPFRALIDTGSGNTFVSENVVQTLKLTKSKILASIKGIGGVQAGTCKATVDILISPRFNSKFRGLATALVMPKLTSFLPSTPINNYVDSRMLKDLTLADPSFSTPGAIDVILGTNVYANIVKTNIKKDRGGLIAQETELGWIVLGRTKSSSPKNEVVSMISLAEIDKDLRAFWEMDVADNAVRELEEECETHFKNTHSRDSDGRYTVRLPFKQNTDLKLGDSRKQALARFLSMEKKFAKDSKLKEDYTDFMREYSELGHMTPVSIYSGAPENVFYLPHHAVFKADSSTTKTRVVFDASCKTTSGVSLNQILHTGPKVQQDLTDILIRWRKYTIVYTADIEKMFRQINLFSEDRDFHRILWREDPRQPVQEYQLNTVTYGTGPATFLSTRILHQLATDEGGAYPKAAKMLREDFYVDDMLAGAHSIEEAQESFREINELMKLGKMNLRKWTSNSRQLLEDIPENQREKGIIQIKEDETIKPLGIHWSPLKDEFQFTIILKSHPNLTMRGILSEIASIFDPTGWLAPVILRAKLIMQSLWKERIGWDDKPSDTVLRWWKEFRADILGIQDLRIPRWTGYSPGSHVQIHGFADASTKAYAACIYVRITAGNKHKVTLLIAKTRVAPLKGEITLPRMELCAAVLLANLMRRTLSILDIHVHEIFAWSDSEIVLAWIRKDPSTWITYIANRVAKIHQNLPREVWNHVASADNPADVASRGISVSDFKDHRLWWRGPSWLRQGPEWWPINNRDEHLLHFEQQIMENQNTHFSLSMFRSPEDVEEAFHSCAGTPHETEWIQETLNGFSSFQKLINTVAVWRRFISNCQKKIRKEEKNTESLNTKERHEAKLHIIKLVQKIHFSDEIDDLKKSRPVSSKSKLKDLNPMLEDGLLKVGGRIRNSELPSRTKNPIILPKCHTTDTIIKEIHCEMLHSGLQLTINRLRMEYWLLKGRSYVRAVLNKCLNCAKHKQKTLGQLMGNLPSSRVTPAPPFSRCGVDYAGPIMTRRNKGRGNVTEKSYLAIFICLVTKAIHIEVVTDLSTDAFLAAMKRFIARRGKPMLIMSDNGTNFVGAKRVLDKEIEMVIKKSSETVANQLSHQNIEWKFIPPGAPHFGGLWEAAVKSVKYHITRVVGQSRLTYEELTTLLAQVEACVNSRPLTPLTNDPDDLEALTPGHFLIGRALASPPQPDLSEANPISRWRLVTKFNQQIWKRWSQEYLTTLQQRTKWRDEKQGPNVGDLVLLKEDNIPPLKWPLARIMHLHPGKDSLVRVVTIKLKGNKTKKCPIHKLVKLPVTTMEPHDDQGQVDANEPDIAGGSSNQSNISNENSTLGSTTRTPPSQQRRPVTRSYVKTFFLTMLHIWMLFSTVFASNYTVKSLDPGIYIESLGSVHLNRGKFRMDLLFDKQTFLEEKNNISLVWNKTEALCRRTKELNTVSHCDVLMSHLNHEKLMLNDQLEEIEDIGQFSKTRKKRGLFGNLIDFVFGNGNSDLYTNIDALGHNHNALLQTMNQQTLLLNARIGQSNTIVEQKLRLFNDRVDSLTRVINDLEPWHAKTDDNHLEIRMLTTYLGASNYYAELKGKYNSILNVLNERSSGVDLVTNAQIEENLDKAHKKLGPELQVTKHLSEAARFRVTNNSILISLYFEIIESIPYELIHAIFIPQHLHNSTFLIKDIEHPLIGADYHHQKYFVLNDNELTKCKMIDKAAYMCEIDVVYNMPDQPSCLVDEIFNKHEGKLCTTKKVEVKGIIWKRLNKENTWFFMTEKDTQISVVCNGFREETLLNTTGILHVKRNCFIKTKLLTLRSTFEIKLHTTSSYMRTITYPDFNITDISHQPTVVLETSSIIKRSEDLFAKAASPVPTVVAMEVTSTSNRTTYTISGIMGFIILAIILWITRKCWQALLKKLFSKQRTSESTQQKDVQEDFATRLHNIIHRQSAA